MLIVAGLHVPVTPLGDVVFNGGAVPPSQMAGIAAKSGVVLAVMVTLKVCGLAHTPAVGVNT